MQIKIHVNEYDDIVISFLNFIPTKKSPEKVPKTLPVPLILWSMRF